MTDLDSEHDLNYEYIEVLPENELPPGGRIFLEWEGKQIVLINQGGTIYAIDDLCTHDHGPLGDGRIEDFEIICPRHGARFDLRTGKATRLPAVEDIHSYPIRIRERFIEIGFPRK